LELLTDALLVEVFERYGSDTEGVARASAVV
jgi:hypothetical protein